MARYVGIKQGTVHEEYVTSEWYCAGCGWPVTDHDSFCPECGGALRKRDANDVENEKLRELVRNLYACNEHSDCSHCPYSEEPCDFEYDIRELGIEVPE